ncbi:MAG: hypothetical protein ACE3L7_05760 [Candidatus Pristimantibacillus sp.]
MEKSYMFLMVSTIIVITLINWKKIKGNAAKLIYIMFLCLATGVLVLYGMGLNVSLMEDSALYYLVKQTMILWKGK